MKKIFKSLLEMLLFSHQFQIQTRLPKQRILRWIELFVLENGDCYVGWLEEDGFTIRVCERWLGRQSDRPRAIAKIEEKEGGSVVFVTLRGNRTTPIFMTPLYLFSFFGMFFYMKLVPIVIFLSLINYFTFFLPAKRLKKKLVALLAEEEGTCGVNCK